MKSLDDVVRDVAGVLEAAGIDYALMGGVAVRLYALPRPTLDVDLTISIPRDDLNRLYDLDEDLGYTIPDAQRTGWVDAVRGLPVVKFQFAVGTPMIDVDVFLAETAFQRQLLQRRQRHAGEGWTAWFVSPEDLILAKLLAGRPKDLNDVADILFIQGQLDEPHLRRWAGSLRVAEALDAAWRHAGR
ncbi:MAG: DUF6036 family nucleotidyltransferase [Gemmataceae bacterium]